MLHLGEDLICVLAAWLGAAPDRSALSRTCHALSHSLSGAVAEVDRGRAMISAHDSHCACGAAVGCPWAARLGSKRCVHLRCVSSRVTPLTGEEMRVLLFLLRRSDAAGCGLASLVFEYPRGLDKDAMVQLTQALPALAPTLTDLSVAGCQLLDSHVSVLADMISSGVLTRLSSVSAEENPFSPSARAALRRACRKHAISLTAFSEVENESIF